MEQTSLELNSIDLDNMTDETRLLIQKMAAAIDNVKDTIYPVGAIVLYHGNASNTYGLTTLPEDILERYGGSSWQWQGYSSYTYNNGLTKYIHYFKRLA
jgi:hypothetical protein